MIINTGGRCDIVNHYGKWLMNRFRDGFVYSRNPLFPHKVSRYDLSPDKVDAVLFRSKNYAPFLDNLRELHKDYRVFCEYTITAYDSDIEPGVPDIESSIATLLELEKIVGRKRISWRYDPVLLTPKYSQQRHLETFESLAKSLSNHVEKCVLRFAEMNVKLQSRIPALVPLSKTDKRALAQAFGKIAEKYALPIHMCAGSEKLPDCGIQNEGCVTLGMLGKAFGCRFGNIKHNGNYRGCNCIESRDVGWYDSCPNGCKYCTANRDSQLVEKNIALHDPDSPLLIGHLQEDDILTEGQQRSFLKNAENQISIFDI